MSERERESSLFRVLLRHHRQRRGMSQLDLSIAAEVSARHLSFLETGRASPSRDMILRLAGGLGLGLRDTNALLQGAGLPRAFAESAPEQPWPAPVERVIARFVGKSAEAALFNPRTRWAKAEPASCTFTKAE